MHCGRIVTLLLLAAVTSGVPGCGCGPEHRPNVLLITVDTLRPDHLGAYGYDRIQTPHIDRLAAEGALFEYAVSDTPWTTPSMSSVMTGTYATIHGFKSTNIHPLALENVTLAETLAGAGYTTAAIVGSFPLDAIFQLDQGFSHYDDEFTTPIWTKPGHEFEHVESEFLDSPEEQRFFILSKALNDSRREDSEVTDAALAWLAEEHPRPFFLWVHYFGPHEKPDWRVTGKRRERRRIRKYDPDLVVTDREVGRLLGGFDARGLTDDTFIVFHADHGESLRENDLVGHGQLLNGASLRIPLILRHPATVEAGLRVSQLARNVDILPTVLAAVGIPRGPELSGESLLPLVDSSAPRDPASVRDRFRGERVAYMETYYPAHVAFATPVTLPDGRKSKVGMIRRGLQTRRWKYERSDPYPIIDIAPGELPEVPKDLAATLTREELYDLAAGPEEKTNVAGQHPDVVAEMRALYERYVAAERGAAAMAPVPLDPEMKLRLKSLGYGE